MLKDIDMAINNFIENQAGEYNDMPRGVTEREMVYRAGNMKIFKFKREGGDAANLPPMLFVPSLINRWYILDLTEETSFVNYFNKFFTCYMIDWGYPGSESAHLPFSNFYHKYLNRAVNFICRDTGAEKVNMLGYCIGGTLSYIYSCLEPERVNKVILLASPINFENAGISSLYAKTFPTEEFVNSMDYMPGPTISNFFNNIQPLGLLKKTQMFHQKYKDPKFKKMYVAMERWISDDGVHFPARAYYEFLSQLYKENRLFKNQLTTTDETAVDPSRRQADCLILNATLDHIVPLHWTNLPPADGAKREVLTFNTGHVGITVGKYGVDAKTKAVEFLKK
ncbi:MAG TPA: alpha/beta fold hydrolase [Candidatus Wallbacteria bacterium]|nr:alpha/beta fold hydrolase [Candidatus Wallbacteria bacterium]